MIQWNNDSLKHTVDQAWVEVNHDPQHRMRILTRLDIYDRLIADMGVSIHSLIKDGQSQFPHQTPGLKRYIYLGIITVQPLFPAWEREADRLTTIEEGMEPVRLFPYDMLHAIYHLLEGKKKSESEFKNEYWNSTSSWHYVVGNLKEDTFHQHGMFLGAVHKVYSAAEGWLPFHPHRSVLIGQTYDENLITPSIENHDCTYHALEATICEDPNEPGWDKPRPLPINRDPTKALEFWRWWLFEAIPQAATADLEKLNWK